MITSDTKDSNTISSSKSTQTSDLKISFLVTGFGPFRGVPTNPTTKITQRLKAFLDLYNENNGKDVLPNGAIQQQPISSNDVRVEVLETSAEYVKRRLDGLYDELGLVNTDESTASTIAQTKKEHIVVIHLGVDSKSTCFKLETRACNEATFRVPDESGYKPSKICIDGAKPYGSFLFCALNLESIRDDVDCEVKSEVDGDANSVVQLSSDAGRFVCNYTYWYSLNKAAENNASYRDNKVGTDGNDEEDLEVNRTKPRIDVLFLHVPSFRVKCEEDQMDFVVRLMNSIRRSILDQDSSLGV